MKQTLRAALELMRPANIITAFADILAGFAAAGGVLVLAGEGLSVNPPGLGWLLLATAGLYGGGVVFNDVFDASLDAKERPERPIPSGRITKPGAIFLGCLLYLAGIIPAFMVNEPAGWIAVIIVVLTLIYDSKAKHSVFYGPLFMGLCRGGNLLLGVAILPAALGNIWFLAFFPVVYIASITLISRGEVSGGSRLHGWLAMGMVLLVILCLPLLSLLEAFQVLPALPFLLLFGGMVLPPFYKAAGSPEAKTIKSAVKRGVISLVLMNSVIAAGFSGILLGMIVLLVFSGSILTAKLFAVT